MKLIDLWSHKKGPTISFELFPAPSGKAAARLDAVVDELAALGPDFFSVTFGAGGSTREGSHRLVEKLIRDRGLEVLAYVNGFGLAPSVVRRVLEDYAALGVRNVLLVRGDPPAGEEGFVPHPEAFAHASDLIAFARPAFDMCIGAAGYPEGHREAVSAAADLEYLKLKVDSGADFVIANFTYDDARFFGFEQRAREIGIRVPILPGVMPVYSARMTESLSRLCGAEITGPLRSGMLAIPEGDRDALESFGVDFALAQCRALLGRGVRGLHFYTMDRAASVSRVVRRLREEGLL